EPRTGSREQLGITETNPAEATPGAVGLIDQQDQRQPEACGEHVPHEPAARDRRGENTRQHERDGNHIRQTKGLTVGFAQRDKRGGEHQRQDKHMGRCRGAAPSECEYSWDSVKDDKPRGPPPSARTEPEAPNYSFTEYRHDLELSTTSLPIRCGSNCAKRQDSCVNVTCVNIIPATYFCHLESHARSCHGE